MQVFKNFLGSYHRFINNRSNIFHWEFCLSWNNGINLRDVVILDLPRVSSNHGPAGLSVVSAPAPVMQRPELGRPDTKSSGTSSALSRVGSQQSMPLEPQLGMGTSTRSTKSQRIRGASNSLRLRQLEMRENHAIVFSWGWPRWLW